MARAIIYTTPTCTYCNAVKQYFNQHGVEYEEFDVSQDMEKAQHMVERTGQTGVPVTEIDGEFIIGFDKPRLAAALGLN